MSLFQSTKIFPLDDTIIHWRGISINDATEFELFLKGPVQARVTDQAFEAGFEQELLGMATSDLEVSALKNMLQSAPPPEDWEVGEGLAECLLEHEFGACWPWNENRDRKTPRASLPGANIVGFIGEGEEPRFLFGEVKTSSDAKNPPGVMSGRGDLAHQIDTLATSLSIHKSLLMWLCSRCKGTALASRYNLAARRYVASHGRDIELVGILLRDTPPHEDDLRTRGQALASIAAPLRVRLDAWYLPTSISKWVSLMSGKP